MADIAISSVPSESSPDLTDRLLCWNGSSASLMTVQQIHNIVKSLIVASASSAFDTLEKLEDGKLNIDGSGLMTGDLDLNSNTLANIGALGEDFPMGGNRIIGLGYPGILVKAPTFITTSDTSWDFDAYTQTAIVYLFGGGGAGGGADSSGGTTASAGSGGGAGGMVRLVVNVAALTNKWANIAIGAAGTGVAGADGNTGGNSTWVDDVNSIQADGGVGGKFVDNADVTGVVGGNGGGGTAGSGRLVSGMNGANAIAVGTSVASAGFICAGTGGTSRWGAGGIGTAGRPSAGTSAAGGAAGGFAAGGGGAYSVTNGASVAGGNGSPGLAIVFEFM